LQALAQAVRDLGQRGGRAVVPLVLTESQVRGSADVFPAEFLDLLERRALLAGEDVLAAVVVRRDNLRHQCEYELRSKLVGLRQAYLLAGAAPGTAHRLLVQSAGGLRAVLRQLLLLQGESVPEAPDELAAVVARAYGVDEESLAAPFRARRETPAGDDGETARFAAHLQALESLVEAIDVYRTT
jgi:hypothetical protein